MSLYIDAASVLEGSLSGKGTLKALTYSNKNLKNKPAQVYALVSQAAKWAVVLKEVIENSGILVQEKKLTPAISLLLTHDLLLTKSGVAAPKTHNLRVAITKHQARLKAELAKYRVRRRFPSVDELRAWVEREAAARGIVHPRWVRINTVKTTLDAELRTTFADFCHVDSLNQILTAESGERIYYKDVNVPNLLAIPPGVPITNTPEYIEGKLILQDKASCFPGVLLSELDAGSDVIDACAAPGNKTSQLGEVAFNTTRKNPAKTPKVFAFEKSPVRAKILHKMMQRAGLLGVVLVKPAVDFLTSNPRSDEFENVTALLLDPSCSGSGIVNRDGHIEIDLPTGSADSRGNNGHRRGKPSPPNRQEDQAAAENEALPETEPEELAERLASLAGFQLKIIEHAMSFPAATRISYSTCSVHAEEDEDVVLSALNSSVAQKMGWRIWRRADQPEGLRSWPRRGLDGWADKMEEDGKLAVSDSLRDIAEGCIRCEKHAPREGTMGFFLAGFVRDPDGQPGVEAEGDGEEWGGFSDSE